MMVIMNLWLELRKREREKAVSIAYGWDFWIQFANIKEEKKWEEYGGGIKKEGRENDLKRKIFKEWKIE